MAEIKTERTAEGTDVLYQVHIHSETFGWMTVLELRKKIVAQFSNALDDILYDIRDGK